eukprot:3004235-Pleurochrysis_carterae.AAC.2
MLKRRMPSRSKSVCKCAPLNPPRTATFSSSLARLEGCAQQPRSSHAHRHASQFLLLALAQKRVPKSHGFPFSQIELNIDTAMVELLSRSLFRSARPLAHG